jgi:hypothetical protein
MISAVCLSSCEFSDGLSTISSKYENVLDLNKILIMALWSNPVCEEL